jgi:cellulose synthase/poly-beta-1,6-N-acetylglucosamine synthase-like glycosyltransferase
MLSVLIVTAAALYLAVAIPIWLALFRKREVAAEALTSASVIICARDEEKDLPACLESLEGQTLKKTDPRNIEVILVDDLSKDRTLEILETYARGSRYPVRVIHMEPPSAGEKTGKWRPLKAGMEAARNEGLLLTDADAVLPSGWIEKHLAYLGDAEAAAGFALIEGEGLWGRIQSLDWLFLLGVGSGLNQLGVPQAALGKNLSIRRSDYLRAGGLEKIGFSLTEDLSLVQAICRNGGRLQFPLDAEMMVSTPAVHKWGEFVHQRKRWASGVKRLLPAGKLCIGVMAVRQFALIIGLFAGAPEAVWSWLLTAGVNFLILHRITWKLGLWKRLGYFPFWEIFYIGSAPILAISFLVRRRVVWKGRKFTRTRAALTL